MRVILIQLTSKIVKIRCSDITGYCGCVSITRILIG